MNKKQLIVAWIVIALSLSSCATLGLSSLKDRMLQSVKYSKRELAAADSENRSIVTKFGTVNDKQALARLNIIKNKLQATLPRKDIDFKIHILNSEEVNAFTTGGRHLYIYKGLIDDAKNDDELACIVAHEMAHSILRHRAKQTTIGVFTSLAAIAATALNKDQKASTQTVINLAAQALPATFSRGSEKEADVLAAAFAYEAGYNTSNAKSFFTRLAKREQTYNAMISAKLLPALRVATNNYNNALNQYNTCLNGYNSYPTPYNYGVVMNAQKTLNYYYNQLQQVKNTYLSFALSNISLFRTHPDSMSRGSLFTRLSSHMRGTTSLKTLEGYDKSAADILNSLNEVKELYNKGFMTESGVNALEAFKKGKKLYDKGKFEEASYALTEALRLKPDYLEAHRLRGFCHIVDEELVDAEQEFRKALEFDNRDYKSSLGLAYIYYKKNQHDKAEKELERINDYSELDLEKSLLLACINFNLNNTSSVKEEIEGSLEKYDNLKRHDKKQINGDILVESYRTLAEICHNEGLSKNGVSLVKRSLKFRPNNSESLKMLKELNFAIRESKKKKR